MAKGKITLRWFGHSAFECISPTGTVVLIDPWLDNPNAPPGAAKSARADLILVTHGHSDHVGNTVEIAVRTGAKVLAIHELALHLQRLGVARATGMNKSGTIVEQGITITMVDAKHSGGIESEGIPAAAGEPAGFVLRFPDGFVMYHAGDTAVFGDMRLIRELYAPRLVLLPIGGCYTMGPREAAKACEFLNPRIIVGMHYGTFPLLAGTPAELKRFLPARLKSKVRVLTPGTAVEIPGR